MKLYFRYSKWRDPYDHSVHHFRHHCGIGRRVADQHRPANPQRQKAPTFTDGQLGSIHAADENLDISAVAEATAFYRHFVENYR